MNIKIGAFTEGSNPNLLIETIQTFLLKDTNNKVTITTTFGVVIKTFTTANQFNEWLVERGYV